MNDLDSFSDNSMEKIPKWRIVWRLHWFIRSKQKILLLQRTFSDWFLRNFLLSLNSGLQPKILSERRQDWCC